MHRKLIFATLAALAMPAMSLAAGQQLPAATAQDHPAASAHANATAGEAGAARIETCTTTTNTLINHLEKGDFTAATSSFDATMKANLGAGKLGQFWKQVASQVGTLQGRGAPQNMMYEGHAVITLPLHFEKGDANAQVACDVDGKVAGFFLRPVSTPASSG
ncbi:MAG TPA: DUF3887 domain-containing protein [Rhodanobacteraceae bacterium]|nr:DUF3887 domain-containing protein [Rhodanobacteraceae bacterium]